MIEKNNELMATVLTCKKHVHDFSPQNNDVDDIIVLIVVAMII